MQIYTIHEAWQNFLDTKEFNESSLMKEKNRFKRHIVPYWSMHNLQQIKFNDILQYKKYLFNLGLSPQSVKLCMSLLRRILNRAVQMEYIVGTIPFFEMPKCDNNRIRFFTEDEAKRLLSALHIKNTLWHDITLVALYTGMRAGEIFSLRPSSVNLTQKTLTLFDTKNSHTRIIPLNADAFDTVKQYVALKRSYLFSEKRITQVSQVFRDTVSRLKLNENITDNREKLVFHSLRHTFASWLVQKGVPLATVGYLLGHKTPHITMRYAHLAPEQGANAVALLPNNMGYMARSIHLPHYL